MTTYRIYRTDGSLLHEGEAESFKAFVEQKKSNLIGANLRWSGLQWVDLRSANLRQSNLECVDLRYSSLESANLFRVNLRCADLRYADLRQSDLKYADLRSANLEGANTQNTIIPIYSNRLFGIKLPNPNIESQNVFKIEISIGCKEKTISEWDEWFAGDEVYETPRNSFEFRQIEGMYKAYREYIMTVWGENE